MAESDHSTWFHKKSAKPFSFFNRSLTLNPSSMLPSSRFQTSLESTKGKVMTLRSLFESLPKLAALEKPEPDPQIKLKSVKSMGPEVPRFPYGFGSMGISLPGTEVRIVVYLTSLHDVRRTFEDCYAVMMIFHGCPSSRRD